MIYTLGMWEHEVKLTYNDYKEAEVMKQWCTEHKSRYRFGYRKGHRALALNPNTFIPENVDHPHVFWFEREEDATWFILRWS